MVVSSSVLSFESKSGSLTGRAVIKSTSGDKPVGVWVSSCEHSGVTTVENENLRLAPSFGVISALPLAIFCCIYFSSSRMLLDYLHDLD